MKINLEIRKERISDSKFFFVGVVKDEDTLIAGSVYDNEDDADRTVSILETLLSHKPQPEYSFRQAYNAFTKFYDEHKSR